MSTLPFITLTLLSLPVLLVGEAHIFRREAQAPPLAWLRFVAKPLASLGFLGVGWVTVAEAGGATAVNVALMSSLALCAVGDICLLGTRRPLFLAGLASFLLGHLG